MAKKEIGSLICKGMTTKEIRKIIKDFPQKPTVEYFINIGYKESTAKIYMSKIRKSEEKEKNTERDTEECCNTEKTNEHIIASQDADYNNLILDTCALGNSKCLELIEQSRKVTVLLATLNEMDELKKKGKDIFLARKINEYGKNFLVDKEKYKLVPFGGYIKDGYVDNQIIEYLMRQSVKERQTLITADIIFAARASCLGIEYILYSCDSNNSNDSNDSKEKEKIKKNKNKYTISKKTPKENEKVSKETKEINVIAEKPIRNQTIKILEDEKEYPGVKITYNNNRIIICKNTKYSNIFYVKGENCKEATDKRTVVNDTDAEYIAVVVRSKYSRKVKIQKIMVNEKLDKEEYECGTINEIYKLEKKLRKEILESSRKILCL